MKFGISSYAFGWSIGFGSERPEVPMDEEGLFRQATLHNVRTIQIADNLPLEHFSEERLERLRCNANAAGIQIEVGARRLTIDRLRLYADLARYFQSPFVRFVIDDRDFHPNLDEIEHTMVAGLPLLDGIVLAIENHDRFKAEELRRLLEKIDSPQLGICLDTANSIGAGEGLQTVLEQLGPWTVNAHIKDIAIRRVDTLMGFTIEGRPAGQGDLDIPSLLRNLKHYGRCRSSTLELWTPREATPAMTIDKELAWVRHSCHYLAPLVERISRE